MNTPLTRRDLFQLASAGAAASALGLLTGCEQRVTEKPATAVGAGGTYTVTQETVDFFLRG